jgi:putative dimethyl sulfoxide reductase chaperone
VKDLPKYLLLEIKYIYAHFYEGGVSMNQQIQSSSSIGNGIEKNQIGLALQPLLEERIFAYDFLRRTFLEEPSKDFLMMLKENQLALAIPFSDESEEIAEGMSKVQAFLEQKEILTEEGYSRLHWDYTRMFIGPYELAAPPWESAYLNKDKLLFQEETRRVRLAYLKYAFLPKHYLQEADDHLGLELDFMYQLATMAYEKALTGNHEAFQEILKDQVDFLEQHLHIWVPKFVEQVNVHASTEFYRGMAQILRGYLYIDLIALNELLDIEF